MRRGTERSLNSFLISGIIHLILVIFLALHVTDIRRLPESIGITWVQVAEPEIKMARPRLGESVMW